MRLFSKTKDASWRYEPNWGLGYALSVITGSAIMTAVVAITLAVFRPIGFLGLLHLVAEAGFFWVLAVLPIALGLTVVPGMAVCLVLHLFRIRSPLPCVMAGTLAGGAIMLLLTTAWVWAGVAGALSGAGGGFALWLGAFHFGHGDEAGLPGYSDRSVSIALRDHI